MEELKGLVEFMAENLVDEPQAVHVDANRRGRIVVLRLQVPEDEMGKVIGRQGKIARAMRTLLTISAARRGLRASLDIHD
ncbi:MAG: KH domain-containing protein [Thermomicrobiaceae bacterium]|nr:KH domain-containing protein [Thermomicrobiaceae bacterium]